jgi:thiamine pyrophosphokinase
VRKAIIFLSGDLNIGEKFYRDINYLEYDIYCADGGANYAYDLGVIQKIILGDLDSIEKKVREYYKKIEVIFKKFSRDKDFTDGELILEEIQDKYEEILILGGLGGRTDHFLTNLNLLEKYPKAYFENEKEKIMFIPKKVELRESIGKTISFIPLTEIKELTLEGFKYEVKKTSFRRASSLCMSNIITKKHAQIQYKEGSILGIVQK